MKSKVISLTLILVALVSFHATVHAQSKTKKTVSPLPISLGSAESKDSFQPQDRPTSKKPYADGTRVVIGADDRTPVLTRTYPWSTIGRIEIKGSDGEYTCTGTLIGPDIVLTNAHCLMDDEKLQPMIARHSSPNASAQIHFSPSMIRGVSIDTARVIDYRYGTTDPSAHPSDDWAILRLDQPLGKRYGYMGWRNLDFSQPSVRQATLDHLTLVGYAGDFPTENNSEYGSAGETAGMNEGCSVEGVVEESGSLKDVLLHRCDSNPGASGGPLFSQFSNGRYYILGLHSGSLRLGEQSQLSNGDISKVINRGVQVSRWAKAAREMR